MLAGDDYNWIYAEPDLMGSTMIIGGIPPAIVLSNTDNFDISTGGTNSGSAASKSIGVFDANRWTYVLVTTMFGDASTTVTIDAVSVGGIACENIAAAAGSGEVSDSGMTRRAEIWRCRTGSGSALDGATTATIAVTMSAGGANDDLAFSLYKVVGGYGTYTAFAQAAGNDELSQAITIATDGAMLACYMGRDNRDISWTNATEASDTLCTGGLFKAGAAHRTTAGAVTVSVELIGEVVNIPCAMAMAVLA